MKFTDHLVDLLGWHYAADVAQARYLALCATFQAVLNAKVGGAELMQAAQELRRGVRTFITEAVQANRKDRKLAMLRSPERFFNVIKELGGIEALLRWWEKPPPKDQLNKWGAKIAPKKRAALSPKEAARRAHIRLCAKACANPRILRDRVRVDMSGQFRLAPRGRLACPSNPKARYKYRFDARPFTDLSGMKAPIWLWPDEVYVFLKYHQNNLTRRAEPIEEEKPVTVNRNTVKNWLDALLKANAAMTPVMPELATEGVRATAIHKPP